MPYKRVVQTGIAQYGYAPEFSYFRSQVGAVIASFYGVYSSYLDNTRVYKIRRGL